MMPSNGMCGRGLDVSCVLCRRHKLRVSGTGRFGYAEINGKMGVVDIHQTRL
jgi:hypothetical protein